MEQRTHKVYYNTHTWLGILSGILLFVVTFSGFPAMFAHELENWQSPTLNQLQPADDIDLDRLLSAARVQDFGTETFFIVPETDHGYAMVAYFNDSETDIRHIELGNYQPIDIGESEVAHIFEHLHTDLHLPRPFGRYLVGLAGMVMLLSIIAGIVIHNKWRKEFVMLRPKRSWRLLLTDQHKLLGLWTLPFSFVLAFTGTILGLLGIISPILALAKFDGNVEQATIAVLGPRAEVVHEAAPAVSLNMLYLEAQAAQPKLETTFIQVDGYGDAGGVVKFSGNHQIGLSNLQSVTYSLKDGRQIHELNGVERGPFQRIFAAVTPLHYVLFGDIVLKFFYAISTLALCALIVSGNMIWLEKKKQGQTKHQQAVPADEKPHILARLTLGICAGLVFSCAATLSASQWLHGITLSTDIHQHDLEEGIFWLSWIAAAVYAFIGSDIHHKIRLYLAVTALTLLSVLLADGLINSRHLLNGNEITQGVHLTLTALALVCGYFSWKLPKPQMKQRTKHRSKSEQASDAEAPPLSERQTA
ncbi:PepSY-associated TM helix domain-containing protein [Bacterioplanoides sp.]|uniref:PepSY-associated TM helix domain-containing protein n=1 Tax=Bacterioplanoides sp. TaxID=2066072 RepID=UPI003B00170A